MATKRVVAVLTVDEDEDIFQMAEDIRMEYGALVDDDDAVVVWESLEAFATDLADGNV